MNILLKVTGAGDRLTWQKRLTDLKRHMPLELKVVSGMAGAASWAERLIWVLGPEDWPLEQTKLSQHCEALKGQLGEKGLLVLVIAHQLESSLNSAQQEQLFHACAQLGDEWLREAAWSESALYLRLFKPRTKAQRLTSVLDRFDAGAGQLPAALTETALLSQAPEAQLLQAAQPTTEPTAAASASWLSKRFKLPWGRRPSEIAGEGMRMKLCICGQSALAYEVAAALAALPSRQVLLMDLDRFAPSADVYTGVKPLLSQPYDFFTKVSATGLNILLDCAKKGQVHREAFLKCSQTVKGFSNLHVLTGVYQLSDYEYYKAEDLSNLVDLAAGYYDMILLKTNSYPYDGFTLTAMAKADYILTGLKPSVEEVRAHRQLSDLLWEKQNISRNRQGWVAIESHPLDAVERRFIASLNEESFIGWVPELDQRLRCERTGSPYLKQSGDLLTQIYQPLLDKIGERLVSA